MCCFARCQVDNGNDDGDDCRHHHHCDDDDDDDGDGGHHGDDSHGHGSVAINICVILVVVAGIYKSDILQCHVMHEHGLCSVVCVYS